MEITKEILNSGCNTQYIYQESNRLFEKIKNEVLGASILNTKNIIFNVTDFCNSNLYRSRLNETENLELTLNYIVNITINMLKKYITTVKFIILMLIIIIYVFLYFNLGLRHRQVSKYTHLFSSFRENLYFF